MADQADAVDTGPVATEGSLRMADDEVSVPDIRPIVDQRRQDRIRHARRRDTRPSWLTFKSALPFLAAIGFISYLSSIYSPTFFSRSSALLRKKSD